MTTDPLLFKVYTNLRPPEVRKIKSNYKIINLTEEVFMKLKKNQQRKINTLKPKSATAKNKTSPSNRNKIIKSALKKLPHYLANEIENLSKSKAQKWYSELAPNKKKIVLKLMSLTPEKVTSDANNFKYTNGMSLHDIYANTEWGKYNNINQISKKYTIYGLYFDPNLLKNLKKNNKNTSTGIRYKDFNDIIKGAQNVGIMNKNYMPVRNLKTKLPDLK